MNDDTRDEAVLWLMRVCLGYVPAFGVLKPLAMPADLHAEGEILLARARHENERPEDRG